MAREFGKIFDNEGNETSKSSLILRLKQLQEKLEEKESVIEKYEEQFNKLYNDFNYNVELIYERDQDIEILNRKIDELTLSISVKDSEIYELQQGTIKLKQLEHENLLLKKKIESQQNDRSDKRSTPEARTPRLDYKSLAKDHRIVGQVKTSYGHNSVPHKKVSSNILQSEFMEQSTGPLIEMSFDLETRIKALEAENSHRDRKSSSLSNSRTIEKSSELDIDISGAREKVQKQEKEISALIKSLQVYKKTSDVNSKSKLRTYDDQLVALNEDIERLRNSELRPHSRITENEESDKKYRPVVRPRSTIDKSFN